MKLTIAIVFTLAFAIVGIGFKVSGKFNTVSLVAVLTFALIGGAIITVHDRWTRLKAGEYEVEVARGEINEVKETAINEIKKEIETQKESISLLTKTATRANEKLEDTITKVTEHQESITHLVESAIEAERKLQKALEMSAPPKLSFLSQQIYKEDSGYIALITLESSKNQSLGEVALEVEVIEGVGAKIVDFLPISPSANMRKHPLPDGKKISLIYTPLSPKPLGVQVKTSAACKVKISGSHELAPIILEIK